MASLFRGRGRGREEVGEEEIEWVRDCLKEKQFKGLGEVLPMELEGEMEEDSIPKTL